MPTSHSLQRALGALVPALCAPVAALCAMVPALPAIAPALCAIVLVVAMSGVPAPRSAPAAAPAVVPAAPAAPAVALAGPAGPAGSAGSAAFAAPADARGGGTPFERVLFGDSRDDQRLQSDAQPLVVYRVPAGSELWLTDVDATSGGLVLWRRSQNLLAQVGFVVDRAAVGLGQSSRSYVTGIRFGPDEELLIEAAGGHVEWAALRGRLVPATPSAAGP